MHMRRRSWTKGVGCWNNFKGCQLTERLEDFQHVEASQAEYANSLDNEICSRHMNVSESSDFKYLAPLRRYLVEKPYLSRLPFLPGFARTNIVAENRGISVHEVSGSESTFALDTSGFEFAGFPVSQPEEWTDAFIQESYIPAMRKWLKRHLHSAEIHVYAYNVSLANEKNLYKTAVLTKIQFRGAQPKMRPGKLWKSPFFRAHCGRWCKPSTGLS